MRVGRSFLWLGRRIIFSLGGSLAASTLLFAQTDQPPGRPYAALDRQGVTYRGPVAAVENELPDGTAVIGMILPLRGPQEAEGKALLAAAEIAVEEEQARGPLADGRKFVLAARDESGPWGQASSEILKLIERDHALALLTSANGATAHQAEQIANKISFPILTLASDPTTTQTNVPWVFRLGPSDADQARAFCQRISDEPGVRRVLLVVQMDHDGRVGGAEFEKTAREAKLAGLERLEIPASRPNVEAAGEAIQAKKPDAIVVWSDVAPAKELLQIIRRTAPATRVFLCSKAAQLGSLKQQANAPMEDHIRVVASPETVEAAKEKFTTQYQTRTGRVPGTAAFEAYEAVHLIAAGVRASGANRVLLREYFADAKKVRNAAELLSFDPAGNSTLNFSVFSLEIRP